jgi:hypothetical protein
VRACKAAAAKKSGALVATTAAAALSSFSRSLSLELLMKKAAQPRRQKSCEVAALRGRRLRWPGDRPTGARPAFSVPQRGKKVKKEVVKLTTVNLRK